MPVYLHGLATAVPDTAYDQRTARDVMKAWVGGDRRTDHLLHRIYEHSGIEVRHSVVGDFAPGADGGLYVDPQSGAFRNPSTAERNAVYAREAMELFPRVARAALERAAGFGSDDVTHVITVSCTGFVAPGPDLAVVRELGLAPGTERYHLGFMGCYGAFPALRMADAFCRADPDAVVLVAAVELCSLHLQPTCDLDALVAASVFADGGAATVVSARPPQAGGLRVEAFATGLAPEGADAMAWTIGDTGFEMVLSNYVPKIVGARAHEAVEPLLRKAAVERGDVRRWAVHPGGRAILDRVESGLRLPPEALEASRGVLARFGNMSSATVLFVLERILEAGPPAGEPIVAMAFGPGLTVDAGVLSTV
ncbi:MAG: type III polyketide synthase [Deinococcales bacterium]